MLDLTPIEFEEFVAAVWNARGFDTTVTQGSNDAGVDVIAKEDGGRIGIQAKRYRKSNRVGGPEVQQYSSLLHDETVDDVVVVTSSTFTNAAYRRAQETGVELVDGDRLLSLADQYRGKGKTESSNESKSSSSSGMHPLVQLLVLPLQLSVTLMVISLKLTMGLFILFLKIFAAPFQR